MTLGLLIRRVRTEDRDAVKGVLTAAFGQPDEADLVDALWRQHAVKIERLAEIGGVIIGYVCYSPITTQPSIDGTLYGLGPLAVAPEHQKQGIGSELVKNSLEVCRENKARLIAVLGEPSYYARFGFEPAEKRKMRWAGFDAGDAFRIIAQDDIDADEIRTIHYHTAFDALS